MGGFVLLRAYPLAAASIEQFTEPKLYVVVQDRYLAVAVYDIVGIENVIKIDVVNVFAQNIVFAKYIEIF
jgi:hypothetical protein